MTVPYRHTLRGSDAVDFFRGELAAVKAKLETVDIDVEPRYREVSRLGLQLRQHDLQDIVAQGERDSSDFEVTVTEHRLAA